MFQANQQLKRALHYQNNIYANFQIKKIFVAKSFVVKLDAKTL